MPEILTSPSPADQPAELVTREVWQNAKALENGIEDRPQGNIAEPLTFANATEPYIAYHGLTQLLEVAHENSDPSANAVIDHIEEMEADYDALPIGQRQRLTSEQLHDPTHLGEQELEVLADPKVKEFLGTIAVETHDDEHNQLLEAYQKADPLIRAGVQSGIEQRYIPDNVIGRLDDALNRTKVQLVNKEVFGIVADPRFAAMYFPSADHVLIPHSTLQQASQQEQIVLIAHELGHKLAGGTFIAGPNGQPQRTRIGFSTLNVATGSVTKDGLDEALQHHLTLAILDGDFATMDPDQRQDGDEMYHNVRKVMATFIDRAGGQIDLKAMTRGFFEDSGPDGSSKDRRQFVAEMMHTYGSHAVAGSSKLLDLANDLTEEEMATHVLPRIIAPEFGEDGSMTKMGAINLDDLPNQWDIAAARNPERYRTLHELASQ